MRIFINILTISRLILSPVLFFLPPFQKFFLILYLYCGFSDIADGWLARRFSLQSKAGAALDSLADLVFFSIILCIWLPKLTIDTWLIWWFITIVVIHFISTLIAYYKYQIFIPFLHTNLNKLAGLALFFMPLTIYLSDAKIVLIGMCVLTSIASIEELVIHLLSNKLERDIPSIFFLEIY